MATTRKISVTKNVYGNYRGYIGGKLVFGPVHEEFRAQQWLDEQMATGKYRMSFGSALWSGPKVGEPK